MLSGFGPGKRQTKSGHGHKAEQYQRALPVKDQAPLALKSIVSGPRPSRIVASRGGDQSQLTRSKEDNRHGEEHGHGSEEDADPRGGLGDWSDDSENDEDGGEDYKGDDEQLLISELGPPLCRG